MKSEGEFLTPDITFLHFIIRDAPNQLYNQLSFQMMKRSLDYI